jgi:hypothetical protein
LEQSAQAPQQSRPPKRQTNLDTSGRYRHTLRLEPKIERELHAVAEVLGVDMNAAMSVCISEHYRRLKKAGPSDT